MSEQQNGFSRMNNVNHSGGTNRPSSGPARSEGSASRRFSNIPLARKIEALILAVVTVIASASVDWSSLTAVAEDGYRSTLNTVVDLPSSNEIVWTYTGRAKGGSDNPYDAVRSAFMNISISGGTADYYVNIYQNYSGNDYTHAKVINNGKGVSTDPIATNQTTDGSFYDYSLWNYGESDANLSPVILSQGEKVAVVVTFVKNSASTVIQYCEGQNEDGDTVSLETNITGIAKFTDSVLEGGENPIIMTTDGGTVSFPNRFYLNPEYMRGVWGVISGSQIVSLNWDARELTPQSDGVTTMVVSADGATSLNVPVVVVSKGNTSYEKTYDGQSFNGISPSCGGYALSEGTDYVASYSGDYLQAGSAASDVINAGNYQVLVTGQGTYSGLNYTQDIVIDRKDISDGNGGLNSSPGTGISLVTPANIVVNAENSTVTSADNALYDQQTGKALSYGTDFTVGPAVRTSGLNTYSITFYGAGNYTGSATVSVDATAYNTLTDISALVQNISFVDEVESPAAVDITFDGKSHKPYVVLKDQNGFTLPLTAGTDYSYQIQNNDTGVTVYDSSDTSSTASRGVREAGTYKVIITGLNSNGSGYTGSVDSSKLATPATFTVKPRTLLPGNFVLQLSPNTFFYNGTQDQHPTTVTAYYPYVGDDNTTTYQWPMDSNAFDITYETYSKGTSTYTVSVTGKGNFTGTVNFRNFRTKAADATALAGHEAEYIHYLSSVEYYIKDSLDEAVVTIGDSNAATTKTADWTRTAVETDYSPTYTGDQIRPSVTVKIGDQTLVQGSDYSVTYGRNIEAGDAYLTITGQGTTYGTEQHTMKVNFTIAPRSIDSDSLKVTAAERTYNGKAQTLASKEYYVLKDSSASDRLTEASLTSAEQSQADAGTGADTIAKNHPNADFYLSYDSDKTNAGTVAVTAHGINNYTGTASGSYDIGRLEMVDKDHSGKFSIDPIPSQTYTGSPVTPTDAAITVRYKTKILNKGTDYTVKYSNNTALSTDKNPAVVTITGAGNYTGSIKGTFKIIPRSLSDGTFEYMIGTTAWAPLNGSGKTNVSSLQLPYTGKEDTSKLTISIRSRTSPTNVLKQGEKNDFVVDIPKDYSVGLHTITVTGNGKYAGSTAKIAYRIVASSLDKVSNLRLVSVKSDMDASGKVLSSAGILVTGKDIKRYYQVVYGTKGDPVPVVSGGSINYTYSWQTPDGKDAGEVPTIAGTGYTVTLTGNGNYKGKVTLSEAYDSTSLTSTKQPLMVGASLNANEAIGIVDVVRKDGNATNPHTVPYLGANLPQAYLISDNIKGGTSLNTNIDGTITGLDGPDYTGTAYNNNTGDYRVYFVPADTTDDTYATATKLTSLNVGDTFKVAVEAAPDSTKYFGWHLSGVIKVVPRELSTFGNGGSAKGTLTVTDQNNTSAGSYKVTDGTKDTTNDKLSYEYTGGTITPNLKVVFKPTSQKSDVFTGSFVAIDLSAYSQSIDPATISADAIKSGNISVKAGAVGSDKATECFSGSLSVPYAITAKQITADMVSLQSPTSVTYDGQSHEEDIKPVVKFGSNTLEKGVDYTVEYYSDEKCTKAILTPGDPAFTNAGTIYVKIMPCKKDSKYTVRSGGVIAVDHFTITKRNLSDASKVTVKPTNGGQVMNSVDGVDYAVEYPAKTIGVEVKSTDATAKITTDDYEIDPSTITPVLGSNLITVKAKDDGNYQGSQTVAFYEYVDLLKADTPGLTASGIKQNGEYTLNEAGEPVNDISSDTLKYKDVTFSDANKTITLKYGDNFTATVKNGSTDTSTIKTPGKYTITYTGAGVRNGCIGSYTPFVVTVKGDLKYAAIVGVRDNYDFKKLKSDDEGENPGPTKKSDIQVTLNGAAVPVDAYDFETGSSSKYIPSQGKEDAYVKVKAHNSTTDTKAIGNYYTGELTKYFNIRYNLRLATIDFTPEPKLGESVSIIENKAVVKVNEKTLPPQAFQFNPEPEWRTVPNVNMAKLYVYLAPDTNEDYSYNATTLVKDGKKETLNQTTATIAPTETSPVTYSGDDYYDKFISGISVTLKNSPDALVKDTDYTITVTKQGSSAAVHEMKNAGTYIATIKGMGNYYTDINGNEQLKATFTINPKSLSGLTLAQTNANAEFYSGEKPDAKLSIHDDETGLDLVEGTDFTLAENVVQKTSNDDWDVGTTITYTATGKGNYDSTTTTTCKLVVKPADIHKSGIVDIPDKKVTYNGKEQKPNFTVNRVDSSGKTIKTLTKDEDYRFDDSQLSGKDFTNIGKTTCTIKGIGKYTGELTFDYEITARDISDATITFTDQADGNYPYTRTAVTPAVAASIVLVDGEAATTLVENTDFTKAATQNTASHANDGTDASPTVTLTGKGNYTGTAKAHFQIGSDIKGVTIKLAKPTSFEYDGNVHTPTVASISAGSNTYTGSNIATVATITYKDADGNAAADPTEVGKYTVVATGTGPFFGTKEVANAFEITSKNIRTFEFEVNIREDDAQHKDGDDIYYYYTGEEIEPEVESVIYKPIGGSEQTLSPDTDYDVTYKYNKDVSETAEIIVTLKGNYKGAYTTYFAIRPIDITGFKVALTEKVAYFTGDALTPDFTITGKNAAGDAFDWSSEGKTQDQIEAEGLEPDWSANIAPGTATLMVTGSGNYTGTTASDSLTIVGELKKETVKANEVFRTGKEITPDVTVNFHDNYGNDHIMPSQWYTVKASPVGGSWEKATEYYALVKPTSAGKTFLAPPSGFRVTGTLSPTPTKLTIEGYNPTYQYTGAKIEPSTLTVKSGGQTLPSGVTVKYTFTGTEGGDGIHPGKVLIKATITYKKADGTTSTTTTNHSKYWTEDNQRVAYFTIVPRPIKSCTFQGPSDARYTGSAVAPIFSINTGYTQLRNGADYTYTVRNNVKPGNAIVTIKGDGKYYIGTTTKVFHIYVAPVSGLTSSGRSGTTAVIRWNRSGTADGYRVTYTSTRGVRKMLITSGSANNYKLTDLGSGSTQVLVEAYVAGSSGQPIAYSTPESIYVR